MTCHKKVKILYQYVFFLKYRKKLVVDLPNKQAKPRLHNYVAIVRC